MRKELRYALRHKALNQYGKRIKELTKEELRELLTIILQEYYLLVGSGKEEFKTTYKETFKRELNQINEGGTKDGRPRQHSH
jgi:hypothetical protein